MATLRARRRTRTSLAIRLTMIAVSVIFGENCPKTYALRVSAVVRGCQSKVQVWSIAFFDLTRNFLTGGLLATDRQLSTVTDTRISDLFGIQRVSDHRAEGNLTHLGPSVISYSGWRSSILSPVNALPQLNPNRRAPRFNLADITPAVLRFEDGHRTQAQLETISLTGGMLSLPQTSAAGLPSKVDVCDPDRAGAWHRGNAEAGFSQPTAFSFRCTRTGRPAATPGLDPVVVWSSRK